MLRFFVFLVSALLVWFSWWYVAGFFLCRVFVCFLSWRLLVLCPCFFCVFVGSCRRLTVVVVLCCPMFCFVLCDVMLSADRPGGWGGGGLLLLFLSRAASSQKQFLCPLHFNTTILLFPGLFLCVCSICVSTASYVCWISTGRRGTAVYTIYWVGEIGTVFCA